MTLKEEVQHQLKLLLDGFVNEQSNVRNGVLLVEGPDLTWKGACGMSVPEQGIPIQPDDQFNIDSIAKMMTATIVMKLVEAGELSLDDCISRYLPAPLLEGLHIYEGKSYTESITIRHLLSHTSGIADNWAHENFLDLILANTEKRWRPEETIEFVKRKCQPAFPPGEGFQYSDPGYNLVGLIIEEVTGSHLHRVYREMLLDPLNLNHTYRPSHESARPSIPGRGPAHRYFDDMECTLLPAVISADWAGGGLISTTEDLDRFLRAFVRNEIFDVPTTRAEMFKWVNSGPFHNYGLGISRVLFNHSGNPEYSGLGEIWGHTGSSDNFMYYWPQEDTIMVATLNQLNCEKSLYDNVAAIMRTLLKYSI